MGVDEREVVLSPIVAVQSPSVNQDEHIGIAQTVHLQVGTHIVLVKGKRSRQPRENILDALAGKLLQLAMTDYLCLHRSILQQVLRTSTCHHHFL